MKRTFLKTSVILNIFFTLNLKSMHNHARPVQSHKRRISDVFDRQANNHNSHNDPDNTDTDISERTAKKLRSFCNTGYTLHRIADNSAASDEEIAAVFAKPDVNALIDVRDNFRRTPLMIAARNNNLRVIQVLLEKRACINARDALCWSAIDYALERGHVAIIATLASHGARSLGDDIIARLRVAVAQRDLNRICDLTKEALYLPYADSLASFFGNNGVGNGAHLLCDVNGATLLHKAVERRDNALVARLINLGFSANIGDTFGRTPLMYATAHGLADIIENLKGHTSLNGVDMMGNTVLHFVNVQNVQTARDIARSLIYSGAPVDLPNALGDTVLFNAVIARNARLVRLLLKRGADRNRRFRIGVREISIRDIMEQYPEFEAQSLSLA